MGLLGEGSDYYAEEVVREGRRQPEDRAVVKKVLADLASRRIPASEQEVWRALRRLDESEDSGLDESVGPLVPSGGGARPSRPSAPDMAR